jgi:predicted metalloendopeptidase
MTNNTKTRRRARTHAHAHARTRTHAHAHADDSLRANNFYLWANQKWLNEVPKTLPRELKYIRPLDNFKLIQDEMYKNVLTMVREYTRRTNATAAAHQMKNMFASFRDLHPEPILRHISEFCKLYNELVQENNIYKFLGVLNQNEMVKWALPVVWNVYPDEYTPGKLSAHICSPSLSLYDYRFYLNDALIEKTMRGVRLNISKTSVVRQEQTGGRRTASGGDDDNDGGPETKTIEYIKYKHRITAAFMRFIDAVFTKCLGRDYETTHNIRAQDVYDIECLIITHLNNIDRRFDEKYANIYQTAKHPDKPPHLSEPTPTPSKRKDESADGCSDAADIEEHLKTPHYRNNIRGATRVLTRDAMCLTDIDWQELAKWIGYPTTTTTGNKSSSSSSSSVPPYFIAYQVGYVKSIMTTLKKEWASDKWKSYWYFIYMRQLICFHDKWRDIYLDFNDTLIRGKDTHFPREYFPIIGVAYAFPKTMTEEFTRRFKNEEMIAKVREIGNTMVDCFKERIQNNTWMSPTTKKGALKKLNTLRINVGEANLSAPDPTNLDYDPKDAWGNLLKRSVQRTEYLARHHCSVSSSASSSASSSLSPNDLDNMNWGTMKLVGYQSFVVNAYYTPNTNSIYIPTAYMHSMNVKFGRGYEYDLASVGFTFGHEISHALHVSSRIYSHRGIIKNWWTRDDVATYERKIAAIRSQYEDISKKDGFVIDGNLSLPENLADVTGLAICEDALNRFHNTAAKADPGASDTANTQLRAMSFYNFYTYYAIQNRQYANRREILVQVLTNPHLNLKIRTNVPLMRSKTFRDVVEIKKGDKMYNDEFDVVF